MLKIGHPDNDSPSWKGLGITAAFLCLAMVSGCAFPWEDSTPPAAPPPVESADPTSTVPFSDNPPDSGTSYTVVGIKADQTLPLYQEPSQDSPIRGSIPPGEQFIHPLEMDHSLGGGSWLAVDFQNQQGWAQTAHLALQQGSLPDELALMAQFVASALQAGDYGSLAKLVHPQFCLRFAPYQFLRETDQVFCQEGLAAAAQSESLLVWGQYDGSGETILLTFQEYHNRFVYDEDYFQPLVVGFDREVSQGNSINNIPDIYPDGMMVEYYFPGFDPQYGGMDWRSLRMVFVELDGQWHLVALVHGEWTI